MTKFIDYVFPDVDRSFQGMRWLNIILRTLHLFGVAGLGGAFLYDIPAEEWHPFLNLTVTSGLLMICLAIWSNGIWLIQLRGVATVIKLLLLSTAFVVGMDGFVLFLVITISGIISHAPGKVRYYMIFRPPVFRS